jgi:hypothetical protein
MPLKDYFKFLGFTGQDRIRFHYTISKGRLADIVMQYESLIDGEWRAIVRYDVAHGFFHRDVLFPNGTQEKTPLDFPTLEMAAIFAEQDLKDKWEFYKERYLSKLK